MARSDCPTNGEPEPARRKMARNSVKMGFRLRSLYHLRDETKIRINTEANRSTLLRDHADIGRRPRCLFEQRQGPSLVVGHRRHDQFAQSQHAPDSVRSQVQFLIAER